VLDRREALVCVGSHRHLRGGGEGGGAAVRKGKISSAGVYTELVDRPHGTLEAVGMKSGARVRNEGVLWFAAAATTPCTWRGRGSLEGGRLVLRPVYATLDPQRHIAVVNAVPEDRLLAGLVPAEIFPGAPDDALKAQAVARRGELLTKIGTRHAGSPSGSARRPTARSTQGPAGRPRAPPPRVTATRGEVLFTADGKDLVDTVYSASCGGHTEHSENVWPDWAPTPPARPPRRRACRGRFPSPRHHRRQPPALPRPAAPLLVRRRQDGRR
jgi:hypothetical protein